MYIKDSDKHEFILKFPLVVDIDITYDYETNPQEIQELFDLCRLIQKNISYKNSNSYLYDLYGKDERVMFAGSGSAKTFRKNFFDRFSELIFNLDWISKNKPTNLIKNEIITIKQIYTLLEKQYKLPKNDMLENLKNN